MSPTLRLVLWPAVLTLAVTVLRLVAELAGWGPPLASAEGGGGGAVIGIVWLVFVFGAWFGVRLSRQGAAPPRPGTTLLVQVGVTAAAVALAFVSFGLFGLESFLWMLSVNALVYTVAAVLVFRLWPALGRTNLLYGVLARLPVIAVTVLAVAAGWDTHYDKVGPGEGLDLPAWQRVAVASLAQVLVWIPLTVLFGGISGSLAATLLRRQPAVTAAGGLGYKS